MISVSDDDMLTTESGRLYRDRNQQQSISCLCGVCSYEEIMRTFLYDGPNNCLVNLFV